jgi:hypothetical protein
LNPNCTGVSRPICISGGTAVTEGFIDVALKLGDLGEAGEIDVGIATGVETAIPVFISLVGLTPETGLKARMAGSMARFDSTGGFVAEVTGSSKGEGKGSPCCNWREISAYCFAWYGVTLERSRVA